MSKASHVNLAPDAPAAFPPSCPWPFVCPRGLGLLFVVSKLKPSAYISDTAGANSRETFFHRGQLRHEPEQLRPSPPYTRG